MKHTTICNALQRSAMTICMALIIAVNTGRASAQPKAGDSWQTYPVSNFEIVYFVSLEGVPEPSALLQVPIKFGVESDGTYVAPYTWTPDGASRWTGLRTDVETVSRSLSELSSTNGPQQFKADAVAWATESIKLHFNDTLGIAGVQLVVDPMQVSETGEDRRAADDQSLRLILLVGSVSQIRTHAMGDRIPDEERINSPLHAQILERSPIKPAGEDSGAALIRRNELEEYLLRMNRHPNRRVDARFAAGENTGETVLDYLVTESKPWMLYAQISNTGTEQTDRLRERFGFFHSQLTNNDDIFNIEYLTTNFDEVHAVNGLYEAPLFKSERVRWQVSGGYDEYTASEVGIFADAFRGESWNVGADIIANVYQDRNLFVDVLAGARFKHIMVNNRIVFVEGEEDFFLPHVGVRAERRSEWYSSRGLVDVEFHVGDVTDIDRFELNRLGRLSPDKDWAVMRWSLDHSVYLEPLFNPDMLRNPAAFDNPTLAHEIGLSFKGQYAFDNRLVPQEERVVGGLYSVRGYPESAVAGDTVLIGSAEYRFHVPKAFEIDPNPTEFMGSSFRWSPQYVFGRPDWDLILRGFVDVGHSIISDEFSFEDDETLVGAGIGAQLQLRRNLDLRVDWGFALEELESRGVDSGSNRVHFSATILF